ncbi:PilN domain-containing protein [Duganella sp. CT11-25]|uniref:PilN domain-containing protein n=1 Tax=unclassified Duganella TaxID=2636909 RepID=UPI0039AFC410
MSDLVRYLQPIWPSRVPFLIGSVLLVALAFWIAERAMSNHDELQALRMQSEQLRRALAVKPVPKIGRAEQEEQKRWSALKAERNFLWTPVFTALERAGNPSVELLEFRPDKRGHYLTLQGEAKDEASLMAFIESLSAQPILQHVHLTHRKIRHRDRLTTLAFEIKANMQPR